MGGESRRRFARARPARKEPVEIQVMNSEVLDVFYAVDISAGGVGISIPHGNGYQAEPDVELIITLPGRRPFACCGKVRHFSRGERIMFGVEFTDITAEARGYVEHYVRARLAVEDD